MDVESNHRQQSGPRLGKWKGCGLRAAALACVAVVAFYSGRSDASRPRCSAAGPGQQLQGAPPGAGSGLERFAGGGLVPALPTRSRGATPLTLRRAAVGPKMEAADAPPSQDELKKQVGYKAVDDYVRSGTVVGLGTGSTAAFAVERVGQLLKDGTLKDIIAIPTSVRTKEQAEGLGIPLSTLDTHPDLDVAIDGADAVDPQLNLVKGGGGALFREKIVEMRAKKFIVIVDESKMHEGLGPGFPVPVEIVPFCHEHTMREIAKLPALAGCKPVLRLGSVASNAPDGDEPAVTDNGNYVVDLEFEKPIADPVAAGEQLKSTVGVVEHGIFTGMTTAVIIAGSDGISVKEAPQPQRA